MPPQRRLAMSRVPPGNVARLPNLDGSVATTAGNLFSIGTPRHTADPEIVRSQDTNQQKQRGKILGKKNFEKKNLRVCVPGQRRLAISRLRVPNPDGAVPAGTGNEVTIGAPRHRCHTVFVRSHHTNQHKQRTKY